MNLKTFEYIIYIFHVKFTTQKKEKKKRGGGVSFQLYSVTQADRIEFLVINDSENIKVFFISIFCTICNPFLKYCPNSNVNNVLQSSIQPR